MMTDKAICAYLDTTYSAWRNGLLSEREVLSRFASLEEMSGGEPDEPPDEKISVVQMTTAQGSPLPVLQLVVRNDKELHRWEFHIGDADPEPSVPHGHDLKDSNRKLDVYHGYVYRKGKYESRVSRKATIRLWNDSKFRDMPQRAIDHFISNNPNYKFSVSRPRRLPRIRAV